jgi:hypothetical protein
MLQGLPSYKGAQALYFYMDPFPVAGHLYWQLHLQEPSCRSHSIFSSNTVT